jgi:hypothetical protein
LNVPTPPGYPSPPVRQNLSIIYSL